MPPRGYTFMRHAATKYGFLERCALAWACRCREDVARPVLKIQHVGDTMRQKPIFFRGVGWPWSAGVEEA